MSKTWTRRSVLAACLSTAGLLSQAARAETPAASAPLPPVVVSGPAAGGYAVSGGGDPSGYGADGARLYGGAEYLLWWMKKGGVPPLATSGNPAETPSGALGLHGTSVLFGGDRIGPDPFSGGRFTVGYWLDCDQTWGAEGNYFFLADRGTNFRVAGTGAPGTRTLAVPFFNADLGIPDAIPIAFPDAQAGGIVVAIQHRMDGAELNLRGGLGDGGGYRLSALAGFRYLSLEESLHLATVTEALPPELGLSAAFSDNFGTRNRFYGGQIGAEGEFVRNGLVFRVLAKVALGDMQEEANISGTTTNTNPIEGTTTTAGGLFTGDHNLGHHSRDRFAVVPEVGVTVGFRLGDNVTATVGYTFLYASSVLRPGEQIDLAVNGAPPHARPAFTFNSSDFWAQGVNFGLEFRY